MTIGSWFETPRFVHAQLRGSVDRRTLEFGIKGCSSDVILGRELTCLIEQPSDSRAQSASRHLAFALRTLPNAEIILEDEQAGVWPLRGDRLIDPIQADSLGNAYLSVPLRPGIASLLLTARDKKSNQRIGQARVHVHWIPLTDLDRRALAADQYTEPAQQQAVLKELESALAATRGDNPDQRVRLLLQIASLRSRYLGLARKAHAQVLDAQVNDLRRVLNDTLALCKKLRRLRSIGEVLANLAYLALDSPAERQKVSQELRDVIPSLNVVPVEQSLLYASLGSFAIRSDNPRLAYNYFEQSVAAARWIRDSRLVEQKTARLIKTLAAQGADVEPELVMLETEARQNTDRCQGTRSLHHIAWIRLLRWEQTPGASRDPLPSFDEVIQRTRGPGAACPDVSLAQYAIASRARRLSLPAHEEGLKSATVHRDWVQLARRSIAEARSLSPDGNVDNPVKIDLLLAEARLALHENDITTANQRFSSLDALTKTDTSFEDRWEVVCGADVMRTLIDLAKPMNTTRRIDRKRQKLKECNDLLDGLLDKVSLADQASALEPHDRALGRVLAMARVGDNRSLLPEVFDTFRRAVRRVTAYYRWPWSGNVPFAPSGIAAQMDAYRKQRLGFEAGLQQNWARLSPELDTPADREQRRTERRHMLELLEDIFRKANEQARGDAAWQALPDIPADELLLICHPEGQSVYCITCLNDELHGVLLSQAQQANRGELGELLFGFWRNKLPSPGSGAAARSAIRRLRVIAHGWLRELDLEGLPFDGQPLLARVPIAYGLDILPVPIKSEASGALLAIHPVGDLGGADATLDMLGGNPRLKQLNPRYFSVDVKRPHALSLDREPYFGRFSAALGNASTFVLLGHVRPNLCSSDLSPFRAGMQSPWLTSICLPSHNALWPGDVLLAERVPSLVLLLGCSAEKQDSKVNTSAVSIATSYVLRGSRQVLATVRDIKRPVAQQMLCYLTNDPTFGSDSFDLPKALQQAQLSLIAAKPCLGDVSPAELADADFTAFRAYLP